MGDEQSIATFIEAIGEQAVDVVVNNAGIDARNLGATDSERDVLTQTREQLMGQVAVNAVGPWLLSRGLLPQLRRAANPRIVNVTSQIGSMEVGQRIGRDVGYAVSKAALNMITVKLAARLREDGIVAIVLHPGHLRTDMGGAAAAMEPADAARQIVALVDGLTIADTGSFRRWDGIDSSLVVRGAIRAVGACGVRRTTPSPYCWSKVTIGVVDRMEAAPDASERVLGKVFAGGDTAGQRRRPTNSLAPRTSIERLGRVGRSRFAAAAHRSQCAPHTR